MKAINKLGILVSAGALLPFTAFAKTPEETYLEKALKGGPGVPVPVAVVSPSHINKAYAGVTMELAFTVDATGTPTDLKIVSSSDERIVEKVVNAVEQWRFTPVQKNGTPVATKVLLPVEIENSRDLYAN